MRLVGDMVVSRARLEDTLLRGRALVSTVRNGGRFRSTTESIERQLRDLREGVMRVRLVPVGEIFRRMPFVVRDLARDKGKRVHLESCRPGDGDRQVPDRADDGSGAPSRAERGQPRHRDRRSERVAAGKRPEGTIRLAASTAGESVILEISDDGRGMDVEACRTCALARPASRCRTAGSTRARFSTSFARPGFSTRDEADRASGRGVGMAVVRDTVQELGGTLSVETAPGRGTTFRTVLAADPGDHGRAHRRRSAIARLRFLKPRCAKSARSTAAALHVIENNELMTHRGGPRCRWFGWPGCSRSRKPQRADARDRRGRRRRRDRRARRPYCRPARNRREDHCAIRS